MRIQLFKNEVVKVGEEFERKSRKWSNIDKKKKEGLKTMKERIDKGEMVCFVTDESGRWSCDSIGNYKGACEAQLRDQDKIVEVGEEDQVKGEKEMNGRALALGRMLGLEDGDGGKRIRNIMTGEGCKLASQMNQQKELKKDGWLAALI